MKLFDSVRVKRPSRNKFNLSHEKKMTINFGDLVPIYLQEIVPGDRFRVSSEFFMRMAPLMAPIMHRLNVTVHYFFVPNRLVWDEWEDFITGGPDGTAAPVTPKVVFNTDTINGWQTGWLSDYFGLPTAMGAATVTTPMKYDAMKFRAYHLIWNEYYRDQNTQPAFDFSKASGDMGTSETLNLTMLKKRAWEKDYFTSALPWAQRGPEVLMPVELGGNAPVYAKPVNGGTTSLTVSAIEQPGSSNTGLLLADDQTLPNTPSQLWVKGEDFDGTATTINDLRRSMRLQEWLEANARGGSRYTEQILMHFGVRSSDARLQRPEYLGGGKAPVRISEVLSTYQDPTDPSLQPQGSMAGHGYSTGRSNQFTRFFEEHGHVIGLLSVLPDTAYQQGINRMWSREDKFDYYWREFANIGEQEILNKELYYDYEVNTDEPTGVFGYQSRYAEYKYTPSTVHGEFRYSMSFWHMGRIFAGQPALNSEFITSDPTTRIFPVGSIGGAYNMMVQVYNKVDALRPMPYFGTPSF